jgi:hypothetical protein
MSLRKSLNPLSANVKAVTTSYPLSVEIINSLSLLRSLRHPRYWGDLDIHLSNIIENMLVGDPTDNN